MDEIYLSTSEVRTLAADTANRVVANNNVIARQTILKSAVLRVGKHQKTIYHEHMATHLLDLLDWEKGTVMSDDYTQANYSYSTTHTAR
jgi:hypothetical protein